jgi:uncharacterized protein YybS (DUF2232 family)
MTKMHPKTRLRIIGTNLVLLVILFGLVSFNKDFLRHTFNQTSFAKVVTGSFPNFIAAYLISLSIVNAVLIRKIKLGRIVVYTSSMVIFIILTIEEFKPMWGASTYYDSLDIIASALGSLLAILTFEIITFSRRRKNTHRTKESNV